MKLVITLDLLHKR